MMALIEELFPICRSIIGAGVRQTLAILQHYIPLGINEVPSGTPVLDWTVPCEWNICDAYVTHPDGPRIVDFAANNLHIVQYSRPVDAVMPLAELRARISIRCPIDQNGYPIVPPITPRTGAFVLPIISFWVWLTGVIGSSSTPIWRPVISAMESC